jgi:hypothetical protein
MHKRAESPRVSEILKEQNGPLPVWVRAPSRGPEYFTGFSRAKLYELDKTGAIRSTSIRAPGAIKGTRLFNLRSILEYIEKCEGGAQKEAV